MDHSSPQAGPSEPGRSTGSSSSYSDSEDEAIATTQMKETTPLIRRKSRPRSYVSGSPTRRRSRKSYGLDLSYGTGTTMVASGSSPSRSRPTSTSYGKEQDTSMISSHAGSDSLSSQNPIAYSELLHLNNVSCQQQTRATRRPRFPISLKSIGSLTLENSGSVARDHLASERTFLAYVRTSLAIASSGVGLIQLFSMSAVARSKLDPSGSSKPNPSLQAFARPLGASIVVMGLTVLCIGIIRYFTIQTALIKGFFPVARVSIAIITIALTMLVTVTFAILISSKLSGMIGL